MFILTLFALAAVGAALGRLSARSWRSGRLISGAAGTAAMFLVAMPFFLFAEPSTWGAQRMGLCGMVTCLAFAISGGSVPEKAKRTHI